jgi:hypothetical protein
MRPGSVLGLEGTKGAGSHGAVPATVSSVWSPPRFGGGPCMLPTLVARVRPGARLERGQFVEQPEFIVA